MAIISTFELLVKRIAPTGFLPPSITAAFRRIVQGYFLNISNINTSRFCRFVVRLNIPNAGIPFERNFTNSSSVSGKNHDVAFDIAGSNIFSELIFEGLNAAGTQRRYRTRTFVIPPGQTASLQILPDTLAALGLNPVNPQIEIRGFAEIFQVRYFFSRPQPNIDLIVTPEIRGTVLDNAFPTTNVQDELDFDQIAYGLPLCEGKSCMSVSQIVLPFVIPSFDVIDLEVVTPIFNPTRRELTLPYRIGDLVFNRKSNRGNFKLTPKSIKLIKTIVKKEGEKLEISDSFISSIEKAVNEELK